MNSLMNSFTATKAEEEGWVERGLTLAPHLLSHSLQPSLVLDEVIDQFGCLCIGELSLTDSRPGEQAPQIRVEIVHLSRRWAGQRKKVWREGIGLSQVPCWPGCGKQWGWLRALSELYEKAGERDPGTLGNYSRQIHAEGPTPHG